MWFDLHLRSHFSWYKEDGFEGQQVWKQTYQNVFVSSLIWEGKGNRDMSGWIQDIILKAESKGLAEVRP